MFSRTISRHPFAVIERSPWSSRHVFTEMQIRRGRIGEVQAAVYESYYDLLHFKPDYIVYLKTSAENALSRCKKRNRPIESQMSEAYIRELDDMYDEAIDRAVNNGGIEVSTVDANNPVELVYRDVKNIIDDILC